MPLDKYAKSNAHKWNMISKWKRVPSICLGAETIPIVLPWFMVDAKNTKKMTVFRCNPFLKNNGACSPCHTLHTLYGKEHVGIGGYSYLILNDVIAGTDLAAHLSIPVLDIPF